MRGTTLAELTGSRRSSESIPFLVAQTRVEEGIAALASKKGNLIRILVRPWTGPGGRQPEDR